MEASVHAHHHEHHEMPTEGRALTAVSISATLHCLTGCAIGEVAGMAIGTALGFSNLGTIALAVGLAFLFGYALTSLPLLRAGLAIGAVIPIALASDTLSIATMEIVDNAIMLVVPGAMEAGIGSLLFWGSLAFALVIAGAIAVPVNRYLIARGKGHAVVHETGIHGGPPVRVVGIAAALAFVFGSAVLIAEAIGNDGGGHGGGHETAQTVNHTEDEMSTGTMQHGAHSAAGAADPLRGLAVSENGMTLSLDRARLPRDQVAELGFTIRGEGGEALRDFEVEHTKRMHLILVRRDMAGFQHLHPTMDDAGRWSVPATIPEAGGYRVFADFNRDGESTTLAADLLVDGIVEWQSMPEPASTASAGEGYEARLDGQGSAAGRASELAFTVTREGAPVRVERYLGADGHLVALREGDLAFLHTHPTEHEEGSGHAGEGPIRFATEYPTAGRYRLFLQFKAEGEVHTAAFTREVAR